MEIYDRTEDYYLYPHLDKYNSIDDFDLFAVYPYLHIYEEKEYLAIKVIILGFCLLSFTAILFFKLERNKLIINDEENKEKDDMA